MPYLYRTVFRHLAKRIATASITFKKQGQETKHHYSKQRRLSDKSKSFTELVHAFRLDTALEIVNTRRKILLKSYHYCLVVIAIADGMKFVVSGGRSPHASAHACTSNKKTAPSRALKMPVGI